MVGEILNGRYEILKSVGFGGMAEVYLAKDVLLDRRSRSRYCVKNSLIIKRSWNSLNGRPVLRPA